MERNQIERALYANLKFFPKEGEIQLLNNRMLMFNHDSVSALRKATIEQVGEATAQMIFAKFGYESAVHDFRSIESIFPDAVGTERLEIGPIMHGWCGLVKVIPEFLQSEREAKKFIFRGRWLNSFEAHAHVKFFGKSKHPVCFSLAGYGSAWCSQFFGIDLLEIERKCVACGDPHCEWEIRPWNEWGVEADPWKESLTTTDRSIISELSTHKLEITKIKSNIEEIVSHRMKENSTQMKALCHDINVPLEVAISSLSEGLSSGNELPTLQAARSIRQAKRILERFRKIHLSKNSTLQIERKPFYLATILHSCLELVRDKLANKGIRIVIDDATNIVSFNDKQIVRDHILLNLLTNAIKFSPLNSEISITTSQIGPGQALISIKDRGLGIPKSLIPAILAGHSEHSDPGTANESGTGHGLSVANFFLNKLGGMLHIESITSAEDPMNCGTIAQVII